MHFMKSKLVVLGFVLVVVLAACGGNSDSSAAESEDGSSENKGTIEMAQINWAENIAVSNMWKVILEDKGYDVDLKLLDMGVIMQSLASGDLDVNLEVWLPVQDKAYLEKYKDEVFFAENAWYDNAKVGLVVPSYLDIDSIDELNAKKDMFGGEITGFDSGAGTMVVTKEDVISEYNLDYELMPSSEPAMITAIDDAISNEEPIVSPLWSPHRVFSQYDLKFLEDPKNVYGQTEKIYHATRQGFADDFPKVSQWMKNWKLDDKQIGELMTYVNDAEEPIEGARKWIKDNQDLVNEWVKE
ncbi:glycine betaine ABC transporter substrate-binding protein [Lentibacillus cibarius]|uniref:Glycine betaine ABC transporter substrate-binding protein n=1 Tax=Lentibacillus cibarius TaxID=2583219 RepID=A0A549YIH9_9BACI|nr:glycine betaine ABC transporter substrate-binding protein [Lentibacillus cibarius]TMN22890.1 glycine betaine ABC transporter substrate-binding protein [Lentibacillus cibarius]TRM11680.1 glycine betaine ABC transporter substrate-binding protein [Lentibacillus cibarius]